MESNRARRVGRTCRIAPLRRSGECRRLGRGRQANQQDKRDHQHGAAARSLPAWRAADRLRAARTVENNHVRGRAAVTIFVPDMIIIRTGAGGGTLQQGLMRLCEAGVDRDGPRAQHRRPCSRGQPDGRRAMIAPSGEQIEIAVEDQQAVVVEVGGGLRSYSAGGRELVDGYGADEMSSSGRGQVLIPWPNRLQDGCYEFDGRRHQLPLNEPEHHNAIHGLVRWAAWTTAEREPHRAVMEHVLHPQPGYPFSLRISIEYALTNSGLRVRTTARNLGTD